MLVVVLVSLLLVAVSVIVHYELLRLCALLIPHLSMTTRSKVLIVIGVVFLAHFLEICLFAIAFAAMSPFPEYGAIRGDITGTALDFFYFSITSYTTLGVGDLLPHGPMRLVSGIEALTGFVLIGWSASFTYLAMEKFWAQHVGRKHGKKEPEL